MPDALRNPSPAPTGAPAARAPRAARPNGMSGRASGGEDGRERPCLNAAPLWTGPSGETRWRTAGAAV